MRVPDFISLVRSGKPVTILDVRSPKAWDSSDVKIQGAVRVDAEHPQVDPSWPKDHLTIVYCT
jgi:rhodanese-related sulfurtransferase